MTLLRRALALVLALTLTVAGGPLPASAAMRGDALGTNHLYLSKVGLGPRLVALSAATAGNLLTATGDLTASPPWYVYGTAPSTLTAQRFVLPQGVTSAVSLYQSLTLTAGHVYVGQANYCRAAGSGNGQPKATFYNADDQGSTMDTAVVTTVGNCVLTYSVYKATSANVHFNVEMGPGTDNGGDFTLLNAIVFDATASGLPALPALTAVTPAPVAPPVPDATLISQFLTSPVWPTAAAPSVANAQPQGLTMAAGATNVSAVDFRVGTGNVTTRAALNAAYYTTGFFGNLNGAVTGVDGPGASYARYRSYPAGHKFDLHTFSASGLTLGVVSKSGTGTGNHDDWYAGVVRDQTNIVPGMTVEVVYRPPPSDYGWMPSWLEIGYQASPGRVAASNGDPYWNNQALLAFTQYQGGAPYYEFDGPDAYSQAYIGAGFETGHQITATLIRRGEGDDPAGMVVPPYVDFVANGTPFAANPGSPYPRLVDGSNFTQGMHAWVMNWKPDGTMEYLFDGKLYKREHQEYRQDTFVDPIDGQTKTRGMHLIVGGQAIPTFAPGLDNHDGTFNPVTVSDRASLAATVQSIKIWKGNVDPSSMTVPTNSITGTTFSALSLVSPSGSAPFTSKLIGKASGGASRVVATSASGQTLTVAGDDTNGWTLTGSGAPSAALPITLTEYPYAASDPPVALPRTTAASSYLAFGPNLYQSPTDLRATAWSYGYKDGNGNYAATAADTVAFTGTGTAQLAQLTSNGLQAPTAGTYRLSFTLKRVSGTGAVSSIYYDGAEHPADAGLPAAIGSTVTVTRDVVFSTAPSGLFGVGLDHRSSADVTVQFVPDNDNNLIAWKKLGS